MKQSLKLLIKITLTVLILGALLWKLGGIGEVAKWIGGIKFRYVILVLFVMTLDRFLMSYKWTRLLRTRGVHLPFFEAMQIYCAAMIWGMFLPSTMGADAIRAFSTARKGINSDEVIASIVIERLIGFLSALLLGLFSLVLLSASGVLDQRFRLIWLTATAVLLAGTLAFAVSFSQKWFDFLHGRILSRFEKNPIFRRLRQFHETYLNYQEDKLSLAIFFGLTFLEQLLPILYTWLIALGIGLDIKLIFIAGAVPLTILVSRIPVSIDGLGVYDGFFALLMSLSGVAPAQAIAITFLGRILQIIVWLPWWLTYVIGSGSFRPPQAILPTQSVVDES